jgi:hypothetical protein
VDTDITAGRWTREEDANLTDAVNKHGSNWVAVAVLVPGRTKKQCRKRWVESLDPNIKRRGWTVEEDTKLTEAVKELGKDWVAVAALVPGRNNIQCRHRWVEVLDPDIKRRGWTVEEDAKLTDAVEKRGKDWVVVAAMFPGRTKKTLSR